MSEVLIGEKKNGNGASRNVALDLNDADQMAAVLGGAAMATQQAKQAVASKLSDEPDAMTQLLLLAAQNDALILFALSGLYQRASRSVQPVRLGPVPEPWKRG